MVVADSRIQKDKTLHLIITDSGLGGLSICSEIERNLRQSNPGRDVLLTYFNAWPEQQGYNDLPDMQSRADVFNRALTRMAEFEPDHILIACNTLSILYSRTEYSRRSAAVPVLGIIEAGVDLFCEALSADPSSSIVMLGTRTTIQSHVHQDRLVQKGIRRERISAVACHGLAAAIETEPDSPDVAGLIEKCLTEACSADLSGTRLYAGLCCTHYTYVKDLMRSSLERHFGRRVQILDPNQRMADDVAPRTEKPHPEPVHSMIRVRVISKVELDEKKRRAVAKRLEPVSEATAQALLSYNRDPGLF